MMERTQGWAIGDEPSLVKTVNLKPQEGAGAARTQTETKMFKVAIKPMWRKLWA